MILRFLQKAEGALVVLFLLSLPIQTRTIIFSSGGKFDEWQSVFLYASDILFAFVLAAGLFQWILSLRLGGGFRNPFAGQKIVVLLLVFLAFGFLSFLFTHPTEHSLYSFLKISEGAFVFYYSVFRLPYVVSFTTLAWTLAAGGTAQALIAWGQFIQQKSIGLALFHESPIVIGAQGVAHIVRDGVFMIRAYGTFPNPNVLAAFLGIVLFFSFALFLLERGSFARKAALVLCQFIILLGLFLTFSRGVILIFFATLVVFFAVAPHLSALKDYRMAIARLCVFLVFISVFFIVALWPELNARFADTPLDKEAAVNERLLFNVVAIETMGRHPALGVGPGNFVSSFREALPALPERLYQPVHNIFFLISSELGIPAAVLFIVFLGKVLGVATRALFAWEKSVEANGAVLAFTLLGAWFMILTGMYDHFFWTIQQTALLFWLMLGLLLAYSHNVSVERIEP